MTLPANIRVNVKVSFPTSVMGSGYVTVTKANGIWTISDDYTKLAPLLAGFDPTAWSTAVENLSTKAFASISLAQIIGNILYGYRGPITAAGDVTVAVSDVTILMNKTVGAATNINLPTSASRNGLPITVKDLKGDANAHNITLVPTGTETIDGFSPAAAAANGAALIDVNYGKKTLYPLTSGGWYL